MPKDKSNSLVRQAKLNAFTSYINFIVNAVLSFIFYPFLLRFMGSYDFGIWKSIQKILDFASIADGRASQALKWVIANKKESSTDDEKKEAIGSAIKIWIYFLPILIILVGVIIWILPSTIKGLHTDANSIVRIAGLVLGMNIILNPLLGIPDAVLVGINQAHKSTSAQTLWVIISNILLVAAAFMGYGVIGLACVIFIVTLLKGLNVFYICKKNAVWFGSKKPKKDQVNQLFGFSFWVMIWSLISKLLLSTETILIGYLIGPNLVTNYTFTSYIFQVGLSVALITGSATAPGLGNVLGTKDFEKARRIVNGTREMVFFVAIVFAGAMLVLNKGFVVLWMGPSYYMGDYLNMLITVVMVQLILIRNESQLQDISMQIRNKVIMGGISAALSIVCGIVVYKLLNNAVAGIFYGILIGRVFTSIIFPIMVNRIIGLKESYWKYLAGIVILVLCYLLDLRLPTPGSWFKFIMFSAVFGIVLTAACFYTLLSKQNRSVLLGKLRNK
ncbi:hypothetical protein EWM62_11850 [Mucilaginibacter terrigena]|uniref:Polysaccharide biosynthesis protein n=1 Tax=Mucilaginibacter terrigena TaxID=2492395 RepID=A0A4Q5LM73_9SPHI|nr:oligosaccharide flippase family protein [Mucilaginibacter terrigena]RYU90223.1 hypothetical protein EWM62_11850 [Mucilaginibacter terrigena]